MRSRCPTFSSHLRLAESDPLKPFWGFDIGKKALLTEKWLTFGGVISVFFFPKLFSFEKFYLFCKTLFVTLLVYSSVHYWQAGPDKFIKGAQFSVYVTFKHPGVPCMYTKTQSHSVHTSVCLLNSRHAFNTVSSCHPWKEEKILHGHTPICTHTRTHASSLWVTLWLFYVLTVSLVGDS